MALKNPWLGSLNRSYDEIKQALIANFITSEVGKSNMNDRSEGNVFIMIISLFSAIAEGLHFYIDSMYREAFFMTARRYSSALAHANMVDYHTKSAYPSKVDIELFSENMGRIGTTNDTSIDVFNQAYFPSDLVFTDVNGNPWMLSRAYKWGPNQSSLIMGLYQEELRGSNAIPIAISTTSSVTSTVALPVSQGKMYVEGSLQELRIGEITYHLVDTFAYSDAVGVNSHHFKVEIDTNGSPQIVFGDGVNGSIPPAGQQILGYWRETLGEQVNGQDNLFTESNLPSALRTVLTDYIKNNGDDDNGAHPEYKEYDVQVFQQSATGGGIDGEDFYSLKKRVPLSIKTLGVAITREDYRDLALQHPTVTQAYVNYLCGRYVRCYVMPFDGSIANKAFKDNVKEHIEKHKLITTNIVVFSIVKVKLHLVLEVTKNKQYSTPDVESQIKSALVNEYNVNVSKIGSTIYLSDLYNLIDSLPGVDNFVISNMYLMSEPIANATPTKDEGDFPTLAINKLQLTKGSINIGIGDTIKLDVHIIKKIDESTQTMIYQYSLSATNTNNGPGYLADLGGNRDYDKDYTIKSNTGSFEFVMNLQKKISLADGDVYSIFINGGNQNLKCWDFGLPIFSPEDLVVEKWLDADTGIYEGEGKGDPTKTEESGG